MHELLLDIPKNLETDRLNLRCYEHGDGIMYFPILVRNREHLKAAASSRLLAINSEDDAEIYLRGLINDWHSRKRFVLGVWEKKAILL